MSYFMTDVETDGPIPHKYSMVCFGCVKVDAKLDKTFYGETKPISEIWEPEALAISGFGRDQHLRFDDPKTVMQDFNDWVLTNSEGRPIFIADNNGFDWQFINYYFHYFLGKNPFGYSSQNLGSLYKGMIKNTRKNFKHLRKTNHDHNPVNDAIGNAEALLEMQKLGLVIDLN